MFDDEIPVTAAFAPEDDAPPINGVIPNDTGTVTREQLLATLGVLSLAEQAALGISSGSAVSYEDVGDLPGEYRPLLSAGVNTKRGRIVGECFIDPPEQAAPGTYLTFIFQQDGTGGTFPIFIGYIVPQGITLNLEPLGTTTLTFVYDGAQWVGVGTTLLATQPGND